MKSVFYNLLKNEKKKKKEKEHKLTKRTFCINFSLAIFDNK